MANVKWFLGVASKRFAAVVAADYLLLLSEVHGLPRGGEAVMEKGQSEQGKRGNSCKLHLVLPIDFYYCFT